MKIPFFNKFIEKCEPQNRPFVTYMIMAVIFFLCYVLFISSDNLFRYLNAKIIINKQEREIIRYNKEINKMDKKIQLLSTDKDSLEQFARENFHFSCPNEDVYLIKED